MATIAVASRTGGYLEGRALESEHDVLGGFQREHVGEHELGGTPAPLTGTVVQPAIQSAVLYVELQCSHAVMYLIRHRQPDLHRGRPITHPLPLAFTKSHATRIRAGFLSLFAFLVPLYP